MAIDPISSLILWTLISKPQPQEHVTSFFMQTATNFTEAVFFVETPTGCILLEDIELKGVSNTSSMVHELSPDSPPLVFGIDKDCTNLIANKSNKSNNNIVQLKDPCFRVREVESNNILPLPFKKIFVQERVTDLRT